MLDAIRAIQAISHRSRMEYPQITQITQISFCSSGRVAGLKKRYTAK